MKPITVVKIGGNVIDSPEALQDFIRKFALLQQPKILVHGGGKEATRLSQTLGVETTMIEGRRVTDRATLDIVTMTYAGLINKRIVALLQAEGCNALGFSGADSNLMPATMRSKQPIDYGFVGDIDPDKVNSSLLETLLGAGITPVMCAICHDGKGTLLNCNADSVASAMALGASRIAKTNLIYCFEKDGVLANVDDESSVIPLITPDNFESLKEEGVIAKGMIPKLQNALKSAAIGVSSVRICNATSILSPTGTLITNKPINP
ncbi:MAG: acetylglutamate kinase [Muribaculaceae bacterium]|nr:acetylglutamate kinase [Muribaculaceae bacterium]